MSGHFVGNFYSTPEDPPSRKGQTFGWTLPVLNCDAVSSWEYNNLYPKKSQKHVDGSPLPLHLEYFAALVSIPVKQLTMQLNLPASISEARRCQHFQLKQRKNRSVPKDEVLAKILYLRPNPKSRWGGLNARWEPAPGPLGQHSYTFEYQPDGSAKVSVDYPPIGSYFSIDWQVPDPRVNERFDHLIREAEFAREQLVNWRSVPKTGRGNDRYTNTVKPFRELHMDLFREFGGRVHSERFETLCSLGITAE